MSAPVIAARQRRTSPHISAFMVGVILVVAAGISLLAFVNVGPISPSNGADTATYARGAGYPLHGGLAGPSRVSVFNGLTFPHGGLAGPSRVEADR